MKAGLYLRYTTRSLRRGGSRTVLACFCIGVGVMAIVGLQLAAAMVTDSLTANVREANGGDVSVVSVAVPLPASQLTTFRQLQSSGQIRRFTAVQELQSSLIRPGGQGVESVLDAVNPSSFPLVGTLPLRAGAEGTFAELIRRPQTMILSGSVAGLLKVAVGRRVLVDVPGAVRPVHWVVGGVLANQPPAGLSDDFLVSTTNLNRVVKPGTAPEYGSIYLTTRNSAQAGRVASKLRSQLPLATVSTVKEALNSDKKSSQQLTEFLSVAGLLALLIGGIGIVNTMQVSLARRRLEIAMLKTTGYRRRDLYLLFGLEAAILGLVAGIAGAVVGIGLSDAVRLLLQGIAAVSISFVISWEVVLGGVGIGIATSCIFAMLPIVRLSRVRPSAVLRDTPGPLSAGVVGSSLGLLALVGVLFWLLASAILDSPFLALWLIVGTGVVLGLLTLAFSGALWVVGRLPVPERFTPSHTLLLLLALLISVAVTANAQLRAVGALLLAATLLGFLVVVAPRRLRSVVRLALRNSGRQRTRTAATAVALFVGVFAVGLILVLGTDIRTDLDSLITNATTYNVIALAPIKGDAPMLAAAGRLHSQGELSSLAATTEPLSIGGHPFVAGLKKKGRGGLDEEELLLSGVQGYPISQGVLPGVRITSGRQLSTADTTSNGALFSSQLRGKPYGLRLGEQVAERDPFSARPTTVELTVVGFFSPIKTSGHKLAVVTTNAPILTSDATATLLGGSSVDRVIELKVAPNRASSAAAALRSSDPAATVVNLADFTLIIDQFLNNAVLFLTAIASLALLAGVVIIANSVALALLERRREIGVQKAVGLSNRAVYSQVLTETATVAWLGATAGMAAIALALLPLSKLVLKVSLGIPTPLALAIVLGAILVAVTTAALVAWGPVQTRPLEVLRYE